MTPAISPLAISCGDTAGIGPEIIGKAWAARRDAALPPFALVGPASLADGALACPVRHIDAIDEARAAFDAALPMLTVEGDHAAIVAGQPSQDSARQALAALERAADEAVAGNAGALVTGPVAKSALYAIGFVHEGQTEFVAERAGRAGEGVMMLAGPSLRVVPITIHVALKDVPALLTGALIERTARTVAEGLRRDFGIARPRLAMAALNPHAGEDGAIGREEIETIAPALLGLRAEGIDIDGPLPADSLFHAAARANYDAVLCPTHDQALIPIKALHFDDAVNMTLGLPIVRTSPDHGTAFGIAGKGIADAGSMIAAIRMAGEAAAARRA